MSQSTLNIHAAAIMDGNGRWATRRFLPRAAGHRAGAEALRRIVTAAPGLGIGTLTAYAFSADNWRRPPEEVKALMTLLAWYLNSETARLVADGVRLSVIGRRDRLPAMLARAIARAECATGHGTRLHLRLAVDYSARDAILRASEQCGGSQVTRERFEELLGQEAPVDLLIRTGGEQRLSDFMLWECAYAELVFTPCLWPDFDGRALARAMQEFRARDRRYGAVPGVLTAAPPPAAARERWLR